MPTLSQVKAATLTIQSVRVEPRLTVALGAEAAALARVWLRSSPVCCVGWQQGVQPLPYDASPYPHQAQGPLKDAVLNAQLVREVQRGLQEAVRCVKV